MNNTYEFELSAKDYARIMRRQRRWLFLSMLAIITLEALCAVLTALSYIHKWSIGFCPIFGLIPLSVLLLFVLMKTMRNGGAKIYGKCSLSFTEDGRIKTHCERPVYTNRDAELGKTLTPKGIIEHKGFYIVLGEKGDWLALPGDAPINQIKELIK
ncbi:MAG: hypothetical protein K6G74_03705 [Bacilli bacterium]|nr:hypothetical protein [Bacilli bacterium]